MGCVSTKAEDNSQEVVAEKGGDQKEKQQREKERRRLSVAPSHVDSKDDKPQTNPTAPAPPQAVDQKDLPDGIDLNWNETEKQAAAKIPHAVFSKKGFVPYNSKKVNQDRAILRFALKNDPSISLFGVMDGHGEYGHFVAAFVQTNLPIHLSNQPHLKEDPHNAILQAVKATCDQLGNTGINISFSGTTAIFALKIEDKLYVANIGDSRCVLCRKGDGGKPWEAVPLSVDQKPENPEEKKRILKAGGRVEPLPGPPGEDCGPPRVWLANADIPGLAMSRSIGDEVSQRVGVISEPEIFVHNIKETDHFIVLASDGVWEFLSNENACKILWDNKANLWHSAAMLANEASKKWQQEEEVVDDITCVIIGLGASS